MITLFSAAHFKERREDRTFFWSCNENKTTMRKDKHTFFSPLPFSSLLLAYVLLQFSSPQGVFWEVIEQFFFSHTEKHGMCALKMKSSFTSSQRITRSWHKTRHKSQWTHYQIQPFEWRWQPTASCGKVSCSNEPGRIFDHIFVTHCITFSGLL